MYNNNEYLNKLHHNHRHAELMRRAERKQLIQQMRWGRPATVRFYQPALAVLGRWLVYSGTYLQNKSGMLVDKSLVVKSASSLRGV